MKWQTKTNNRKNGMHLACEARLEITLSSKTKNNSSDDKTSVMMTKTTTSSSTSTTDNNGSSSSFQIKSCSPQGLVDALMNSRGKEETIKILRESYELVASSSSSLPSSLSLLVSPNDKKIAATDDNNNNDDNEKLLGEALLSEPIETSILSPRLGKFSLQLYENGLMATKMNDPTIKITLLADNNNNNNDNTSSSSSSTLVGVSHAILFPKPEDCKVIVSNRKEGAKQKKTGGNLVLLRLSSAISVPKLKSPTRQLCFVLPADTKLGRPIGPSLLVQSSSPSSASSSDTTSTSNDNDNSKQPTEEWGKVLKQALGGRQQGTEEEQKESLVLAIIRPGIDFKSHQPNNSSSTTAGMPFVNCYLGVNDGVLYPLKEGLLFYKPPRFLPRSDLHSIACGRGGGDSSRYVDMVVQCNSSEKCHNKNNNNSNDDKEQKAEEEEQQETVEFTNINREENLVLNSYIHDVLIPAMTDDAHRASATAKKAKGSTSTKKNSNSNSTDDDDDDDDSAEVVAIAEVDADDDNDEYEKIELVQAEETESDDNDGDDDDDDDEDFEGEDDDEVSDDDSDDDDDSEEDDEGVAVVPDELAQELVKEKRRKQKEDSATDSEDEGDGPRVSKRLRRGRKQIWLSNNSNNNNNNNGNKCLH